MIFDNILRRQLILLLLIFRLFERLHQQQAPPNNAKRSNGMPPPPGGIEPMAKDLVDEETDYASDYDMETSLYSSTAGSSSSSLNNIINVVPDSHMQKVDDNADILPSIEELTKSMQDLTEQDLIPINDQDIQNKKKYCEKVYETEKVYEKEKVYETQQCQNSGGTLKCATDEVLPLEANINLNEFVNFVNVSNENNILRNENDISTDITEQKLLLAENKLTDMDNVPKKYIHVDTSNESNDIAKSINEYQNTIPSLPIFNSKEQRHRNPNEINKLQDEIENLLAPLSTDVSMQQDDVNENNIQIDETEEVNYYVGAELDMVENIDDNATKKHFVTPSTTKINVSEMIINVDENELQHESYTQAEKRARLGSISNSSSTCSFESSPFELYDVHEGVIVVEHAVIETLSSGTDQSETAS